MTAPNLATSSAPTEPAIDSPPWSAERFFDLLQQLGRLRVISVCGPSVFESICVAGPYEVAEGFLNMVTDAFHWHVGLARLRHLQSHDNLHGRSGRNVLFFELRERADATPFLRIYVYRAPGVEFASEIAQAFQRAHRELEHGVLLTSGEN
ncbi:hypothetical protein K2X89_12880 [Myxococcota bacterium]|nr:hypothetical protein [Myxococcota bacterium]